MEKIFRDYAEVDGIELVGYIIGKVSVGINSEDTGLLIELEKTINGGVIGINAYKNIVGAQPGRNGIARMCDHIQYISNLVGPEHVGVGLDLCDSYYYAYYNVPDGDEHGPELGDCLKNHSELVALTAELIRRGVPEEAIRKFLGENFIHYFCEILA